MNAAVVFDLDGTLADTATDIARSLNAVLVANNLHAVELAHVRYMIGRGPTVLVERALRHLDISTDAAHVARLSSAFVDHYAATREWEEREFRKAITDWELERYFEII